MVRLTGLDAAQPSRVRIDIASADRESFTRSGRSKFRAPVHRAWTNADGLLYHPAFAQGYSQRVCAGFYTLLVGHSTLLVDAEVVGLYEAHLAVSEDDIVQGLNAATVGFHVDADPVDEAPVFVLSAGWRSGSTALQRLLSSSTTRIWGEPLHLSGVIPSLARQWAPFSPTWPDPRHVLSDSKPDVARNDSWIANMYPPPIDLLRGQRALMRATFAEPAYRAGCTHWGLKEVRLGGGVAAVLKTLFPMSRVIFLVRNPYDAFASYHALMERRGTRGWYAEWPHDRVTDEVDFGAHWRRLAESFVLYGERAQALLVRYEELGDNETLDAVESHAGIPVDRSAVELRVGSSFDQDGTHMPTDHQVMRLAGAVGSLAEEFGYFGPTQVSP